MSEKIIQISAYASDDIYGNESKGVYALTSDGVVFDGQWCAGRFTWDQLPPIKIDGVNTQTTEAPNA